MAGDTQIVGGRPAPVRPGTPGGGHRDGRRRWLAVAAGVMVVAAGSVLALAVAGGFAHPGQHGSGGAAGTSTGAVSRQTLISQTAVNATLGYAGSYPVTGRAPGTITWLPAPGRVLRQGGVLYRTGNGVPAYLLYGRVPAWRALWVGMRGEDVRQLNHDLAALGYASRTDISALGWDYFSWETTYGLMRLQHAVGRSQTGQLSLGQAVFEPGALRVSAVSASLGAPATGRLFTATSARPVVTIPLSVADEPEVRTGDQVTVTMPDGRPTPGVVSSVGKVAHGTGSSATITVDVRLLHPAAAGELDQAPVTVDITTGRVKNALVVPVDALLARPGGYAVEVVTGSGTHRLVTVRVGMFDGAAGLVQVSGPGLAVGQHVVVPSL